MKIKKLTLALATCGALAASGLVSANQINGAFSIGDISGGTVTTNFTNPSFLTFNPNSPTNNVTTAQGGVVGDFLADPNLALNTNIFIGTIENVPSNPYGPKVGFISLSFGTQTISFDLQTLTLAPSSLGNSQFVLGNGVGTLNVTGYDPTTAYFSFTTQQSNNGANTNTWSASIDTTPPGNLIPEIDALAGTGALTLLGGALALAGERRRRTAAAR